MANNNGFDDIDALYGFQKPEDELDGFAELDALYGFEPQAPAPDMEDWDFGDVMLSLGAGTFAAGETLVGVVNTIGHLVSDDYMGSGFQEGIESADEFLEEGGESLRNRQSPGYRAAQENQIYNDETGEWSAPSIPQVVGTIAEALPQLPAYMGVAGIAKAGVMGAAKLAGKNSERLLKLSKAEQLARKAKVDKIATVGSFGVAGATLGGSDTFNETYDAVIEKLADSEFTEVERHRIAEGLARTAAATQMPIAALTNMVGLGLAATQAGKTILHSIAKGAATDAIPEAIEEGSQGYQVGLALHEADTNHDPMDGVIHRTALGGIAGGGMGGAIAGGTHGAQKAAEKRQRRWEQIELARTMDAYLNRSFDEVMNPELLEGPNQGNGELMGYDETFAPKVMPDDESHAYQRPESTQKLWDDAEEIDAHVKDIEQQITAAHDGRTDWKNPEVIEGVLAQDVETLSGTGRMIRTWADQTRLSAQWKQKAEQGDADWQARAQSDDIKNPQQRGRARFEQDEPPEIKQLGYDRQFAPKTVNGEPITRRPEMVQAAWDAAEKLHKLATDSAQKINDRVGNKDWQDSRLINAVSDSADGSRTELGNMIYSWAEQTIQAAKAINHASSLDNHWYGSERQKEAAIAEKRKLSDLDNPQQHGEAHIAPLEGELIRPGDTQLGPQITNPELLENNSAKKLERGTIDMGTDTIPGERGEPKASQPGTNTHGPTIDQSITGAQQQQGLGISGLDELPAPGQNVKTRDKFPQHSDQSVASLPHSEVIKRRYQLRDQALSEAKDKNITLTDARDPKVQNVGDPRWRRADYQGAVGEMASLLKSSGGNPSWFTDAPARIKRLGVNGWQRAVEKAHSGEALNKAERQVIHHLLDQQSFALAGQQAIPTQGNTEPTTPIAGSLEEIGEVATNLENTAEPEPDKNLVGTMLDNSKPGNPVPYKTRKQAENRRSFMGDSHDFEVVEVVANGVAGFGIRELDESEQSFVHGESVGVNNTRKQIIIAKRYLDEAKGDKAMAKEIARLKLDNMGPLFIEKVQGIIDKMESPKPDTGKGDEYTHTWGDTKVRLLKNKNHKTVWLGADGIEYGHLFDRFEVHPDHKDRGKVEIIPGMEAAFIAAQEKLGLEPGTGKRKAKPQAKPAPKPDEPDLTANTEKEPEPKTDSHNESKLDQAADSIDAEIKAAAQELADLFKASLGNKNSGVDPAILAAGAKLGALYVAKGIVKFAQYSRAIINQMKAMGVDAKHITPVLKEFYGATQMKVSDELFDKMDDARTVRAFDLATLDLDSTNEQNTTKIDSTEKENADDTVDGNGPEALDGVSAENDGVLSGAGNAGSQTSGGGQLGPRGTGDSSGAGNELSGGEGDSNTETSSTATGGGGTSGPRSGGIDAEALDHTIDSKLGEGGDVAKFNDNITAIKLLKTLQDDNRNATPKEQKLLARYVGWGGLKQAFLKSDGTTRKGWDKRAQELKALLTDEEYAAARRSTLDAHYTSNQIIGGIYSALAHLGFTNGRILEPSVGVGNFFGLMPSTMKAQSQLTGVELDAITGGIASKLYPKANILASTPFEKFPMSDGFFDIVIGNPPFGSQPIYDGQRKDISGFSIHNYFFAKAIHGLRENGLIAMVVSKGLLDKVVDKQRVYMASRVELLGAIRLPNNAFKANAGTEVTTDILFMRKLAEGESPITPWTGTTDITGADGNKIRVNEYFAAHPEMMLGEMRLEGSMYRDNEAALIARDGQDTGQLLTRAIKALPQNIYSQANIRPEVNEDFTVAKGVEGVPEGSFFFSNGKLQRRIEDVNGEARSERVTHKINSKGERTLYKPVELARMEKMTELARTLNALLKAQLNPDIKGTQLKALRNKLNRQYDAMVKDHGFINAQVNKALMNQDVLWPRLAALEVKFDKGLSPAVAKKEGVEPRKAKAIKADIFNTRTQVPHQPVTSVSSAKEGLATVLSELGRVDIDEIVRLYGKNTDVVIKELGDLVMFDPSQGWQTVEEYLSGNVKLKLAQAKQAVTTNKDLQRNIDALEKVIPEDIPPADIKVKPGAPWLPPQIMKDFINHLNGEEARSTFHYVRAIARWTGNVQRPSRSLTSRWGVPQFNGYKLFLMAANNKIPKVVIKGPDGESIVDAAATEAAQQKVNEIKQEFTNWIWDDAERRKQLAAIYNEGYNTSVKRRFDGAHLELHGKVSDEIIQLRPHQKNFVWRVMQTKTALADHVVGAGKTMALVSAIMELKRTGMARKSMLVVPNHLVTQWSNEFLELYPNANILVPDKKDFQRDRRKVLFGRIATGDWDAVIVAHSTFKKLPSDVAENQRFIEQQMLDLQESIDALLAAEGRTRSVADMEKMLVRLQAKLSKLTDVSGQDTTGFNFQELGIDAMFVDEAHEFKNLEFMTSLSRMPGINPSGSGKAADMFVKTQSIINAGGRVVFATGTPISNSMAEMYTVQKYLGYKALKDKGMAHFDAWANIFGEVVTDHELDATGVNYRLHSRFSKFVNLPELMQDYHQFADTITRDDIEAMLKLKGQTLGIPKIKTGKPINVVVDRSPAQAAYMDAIIQRAENMPTDPREDNMLKVTNDARKAALDMRLVDPEAADYPGSKVNVSITNILEIARETNDVRGTQLVFLDLSTPKKAVAKARARIIELEIKAEQGDEKAQADLDKITPDEMAALESSFSVYDDMRAKLIAGGLKESEVAFIHDANTDIKKQALFESVKRGDIRVLLGSTAKMGAGMNVQERLVALHHLDAPWKPSDLEQREGRIIRQKNALYLADPENFEIGIYRYATEKTYDSRMWQTIETKALFIEQLRTDTLGSREMDDVGGEAASSAEMKAAASGNPLILEEFSLRARIRKLELQERAHNTNQWTLQDEVKQYESLLEVTDGLQAEFEEDIKTRNSNRTLKDEGGIEFEIKIGNTNHTKRPDAGKDLLVRAQQFLDSGQKDLEGAGIYQGFSINLIRIHTDSVEVVLANNRDYGTQVWGVEGQDPSGLMTKLSNLLLSIESRVNDLQDRSARAKAELPKARDELGQEFKAKDELEKARARHAEVLAELTDTRPLLTNKDDAVIVQLNAENTTNIEPEYIGLWTVYTEGGFAFKNHPEYGFNTEAEAHAWADDQVAKNQTADDPLAKLGDNKTHGASVEKVKAWIKDVAKELGGAIEVVATYADLPDAVKAKFDERIRGAYYNGKMYLVADKMANKKMAQETTLHEMLGHAGVMSFLGDKLDATVARIFKSMGKKAREDLAKRYGLDLTTKAGQRELVLEYIAHAAETGQRPSLVQKFVSAIKAVLRKIFPGLKWSDGDILSLIEQSRVAMKGEADTKTHDASRRKFMKDLAALALAMAVNPAAAAGELKLGKAKVLSKEDADKKISDKMAKALNGKTVKEAMELIRKDAPDSLKSLIDTIIKLAADSDAYFAMELGKNMNAYGATSLDYRGRVFIRIFKGGDDYGTILHEALHSLVMTRYAKISVALKGNYRLVEHDLPNAMDAISQLHSLRHEFYRAVKKEFGGKKNIPRELREAVSDPDEFFVRALTDPATQAYMASKRYEGKTLLERFTDWVKTTFFGSESGTAPSWLDAALVGANDLLAAMKGDSANNAYSAKLEEFQNKRRSSRADKDDDIFARLDDTADTEADLEAEREGFTVYEPDWKEDFIRNIQDKFVRVKIMQKAIREKYGADAITDEEDVYQGEEVNHGRAEKDLKHFNKRFIDPLVNAMKAAKVTQEELDQFLYAKFAAARNEEIANKRDDMPGAGSGMTNKEAADILAGYSPEKRRSLEKLAKRVYRMGKFQRQLFVLSGLKTQEEVDGWNSHEFYVPLKGNANKKGFVGRFVSGGFSVKNRTRAAMGRASYAESPLVHMIAQVEETILEAEKNRVALRFLKLVRKFPNAGYWKILKSVHEDRKPRINKKTGKVEFVANMNLGNEPDVVTVREGGKERYIKIEDPLLVRAMKNLGPEPLNRFERVLSKINVYLAMINVALNPEFIYSNFFRDLQTAMLNLDAESQLGDGKVKGEKLMKEVLGNVGNAFRAILSTERSDSTNTENEADPVWAKHYEEYLNSGAKVGFFGLEGFDTKAKNLQEKLAEADGNGIALTKEKLRDLKEMVLDLNGAIENAVRLSAYVSARKAGLSREKAGSLAKNLTVNFNRKGELGNIMSSLYLFANASVQGTANLARTLKGKQGMKKMALLVGASSALTALNYAISDDDEDGRSYYDKIPDYIKERNVIFMIPGSRTGDYLKIPSPYGYNTFNVAGMLVTEVAMGSRKMGSMASMITNTFLGSFNPMGSDSSDTSYFNTMAKVVSPTFTDPFIQIAINENFHGGPVHKPKSGFGVEKPNSHTYFRSTGDISKTIVQSLNSWTGGTAHRSGYVDINPDDIEHLAGFLTGAVGGLVMRTGKTADSLARGEVPDLRQVPFARKVYGTIDPRGDMNRYYERRKVLDQFEAEWKQVRKSDVAERSEWRREYKAEYSLFDDVKRTDKRLSRLRKLRKRIEASGMGKAEKKAALERMDERIQNAVTRFNTAWEKSGL